MKTLTLSEKELPFDLDLTFSCGQIFGWKKSGDIWKGVHNGRIIAIRQDNRTIRYSGCDKKVLYHFLGLKDNIPEIYQSICTHIAKFTHEKQDLFFLERFLLSKGIRILRQDPWECLFSFICSSNSNVRTIGKRIGLLMENYGTCCSIGENLFPEPVAMGAIDEESLRKCLTGYRAPYLMGTAEYIITHPDFFLKISSLPYPDAKKELMILPGVGPKVADCVLLFGFERMEAVPVDIRIRKIITAQYQDIIPGEKGTKTLSYDTIADFCRSYFGPYAGYAQQYLFATRDVRQELSV